MTLEGLLGEGFVVLAANGQENAPLLKAQEPTLEVGVGFTDSVFAELDAFQTVFAENAAPERVVEVENDGLVQFALERGDKVGQVFGQASLCVGREDHIGGGVEWRAEGVLAAERGNECGEVGNKEVGDARSKLVEPGIEAPEPDGKTLFGGGIGAEDTIGHGRAVEIDELPGEGGGIGFHALQTRLGAFVGLPPTFCCLPDDGDFCTR